MTVVDIRANLLGSMELIYEQSRPEVRGLWRDRVDPHLRLRAGLVPGAGDWSSPWLELEIEPNEYLDFPEAISEDVGASLMPGMLHDRPLARLKGMDAAAVDIAVLHPLRSAAAIGSMNDVSTACGLLAGYNRYLGTYCSADPVRLRGVIQLHGLHLDWSLLELRRLADRPWVAGVSVRHPGRVPVWEPQMRPLFDAIAGSGLPVFHRTEIYGAPGFPGSGDIWSQSRIAEVLAEPWDAQRQVTALLTHSVLAEHQELRVCLSDGGAGWIPSWLEKIASVDETLAARARRMLASGRLSATVAPYETTRAIQHVVDAVGDRCLVWGSNHPRHPYLGPVGLASWDVDPALQRRVLGENALGLVTSTAGSRSQEQEESRP